MSIFLMSISGRWEECYYLRELQSISLLCITMTAVLADLKTGYIPNGIIVTGLLCGAVYQIFAKGLFGIILFLGGALFPILFFSVFYYFRMIGAGDIKLLCIVGGYFGPSRCFSCIAASILFGGVISLALTVYYQNFIQRICVFIDYVSQYSKRKIWKPYLPETTEESRFCFSVPVLLGVISQVGGMI